MITIMMEKQDYVLWTREDESNNLPVNNSEA